MENDCDHGSFHWRHVHACHCPCVLVDVGLNTGQSLMNWALMASKREERSLRTAKLAKCIASKDTCFYGFEANPAFDEPLLQLEARLRQGQRRVKIFTSTAFNVHSDPATLYVQPTPSMSNGSALPAYQPGHRVKQYAPGSTLVASKAGFDRAPVHGRNAGYRATTVRSMDASVFFLSVLDANTGFAAAKIECALVRRRVGGLVT